MSFVRSVWFSLHTRFVFGEIHHFLKHMFAMWRVLSMWTHVLLWWTPAIIDTCYFYITMACGAMYRRLRGINREIGFGFVSCSCRACVRAGEAKLRGRVRRVSSQRWCLWRWDVLLRRLLRHRFCLCVFATIHKGFKENQADLLLYTKVLRKI